MAETKSYIPGYTGVAPKRGKPYDCADATFVKYGKEINIHDFIQEDKNDADAKLIIQQAGGLEAIAQQVKQFDDAPIVIDLNMDAIQANQILKAGRIAQRKLDEMKAAAEAARIAALEAAAAAQQPTTTQE